MPNKTQDGASALKMKKRITVMSILFTLSFCLIIFSVMLATFLRPARQMSEKENRVLEQRPSFRLSAVLDGSFMKSFESFMSDQFPLRDASISVKTFIDLSMGKRTENGVYIGKKGFLFQQQTPFDEEDVKRKLGAINAHAKEHKQLKTAFVLAPNSSYVLQELMPYGLRQDDQSQQLGLIREQLNEKRVTWIDCLEAFDGEQDKKLLYYHNDHHWTTRAAYLTFCSLADRWGFNLDKSAFELYTVSNSFAGTLASSAGITRVTDSIQVCTATKNKVDSIIVYETSGNKSASFFDRSKLGTANEYELFLSGNYDKIVVGTTAKNSRTLLLIKDSYANCMVSMLSQYFSTIVIVDPRYFSDRLSEMMGEYDFTHMLYVYNLNTFLSDASLIDALES